MSTQLAARSHESTTSGQQEHGAAEQATIQGPSEQILELKAELLESKKLIRDITKQVKFSNKMAFTISEAAEALGVSRGYVYTLIHTNSFPVMNPNKGSRYLISREMLNEWMRRNSWPLSWGTMPERDGLAAGNDR